MTVITSVIFADVDGPLSPIRAWALPKPPREESRSFYAWDPVACAMVKNVCDRTGGKVVVSSSWRLHGKEDCLAAFAFNGITAEYIHEDWATKVFRDPNRNMRADEIREWLSRHPEVTKFAAIDDDTMDIENFVHVSTYNGLMFEHWEQMLTIFGVKDPEPTAVHNCPHKWEKLADETFKCMRCEVRAKKGDKHCPWTAGK